jgi:hypothetical protein
MFDFLKTVRSPEHRLAWLVAIAADAIQIGALPLFAAGGLSPADALLDLGVAAILIRLLGWHWAFLPALLAELVPGSQGCTCRVRDQKLQEREKYHQTSFSSKADKGYPRSAK